MAEEPPPSEAGIDPVRAYLTDTLGFDHDLYTEHVTSKILRTFTFLDVSAEDDDHLEQVDKVISNAVRGIDEYKTSDVQFEPSEAARLMLRDSVRTYAANKVSQTGSLVDSILSKPIVDQHIPLPRVRLPILTTRAILETPQLHRGTAVLPSTYSQMGPKGKFPVLKLEDNISLELKTVDQDQILKMKLHCPARLVDPLKQFHEERKDLLEPYLALAKGEVANHPIWAKWKREQEYELDFIRHPTRSPIMPLHRYPSTHSEAPEDVLETSHMLPPMFHEDSDYTYEHEVPPQNHIQYAQEPWPYDAADDKEQDIVESTFGPPAPSRTLPSPADFSEGPSSTPFLSYGQFDDSDGYESGPDEPDHNQLDNYSPPDQPFIQSGSRSSHHLPEEEAEEEEGEESAESRAEVKQALHISLFGSSPKTMMRTPMPPPIPLEQLIDMDWSEVPAVQEKQTPSKPVIDISLSPHSSRARPSAGSCFDRDIPKEIPNGETPTDAPVRHAQAHMLTKGNNYGTGRSSVDFNDSQQRRQTSGTANSSAPPDPRDGASLRGSPPTEGPEQLEGGEQASPPKPKVVGPRWFTIQDYERGLTASMSSSNVEPEVKKANSGTKRKASPLTIPEEEELDELDPSNHELECIRRKQQLEDATRGKKASRNSSSKTPTDTRPVKKQKKTAMANEGTRELEYRITQYVPAIVTAIKKDTVKNAPRTRKMPDDDGQSLDSLVLSLSHDLTETKNGRPKKTGNGSISSSKGRGPLPSNDIYGLNGFLALRKQDKLIEKPNQWSGSLPSILHSVEEDPEEWKSNKEIQNPQWYTQTSTHSRGSRPSRLLVLIAPTILQNVPLVRALDKEGLELMEQDSRMQQADIVLSPSTAVVLHDFSRLRYTHEDLFDGLKFAATYYTRIIVVFEVVPFSLVVDDHELQFGGRRRKTQNPLTPDSMSGLRSLRRLYEHAFGRLRELIGDVEFVFAYNGAGEVASALNLLIEREADRMQRQMGPVQWGEIWNDREWMRREPLEWEMQALIDSFRLNTFGAWYVLYRIEEGGLDALENMSAEEREETFGSVFGVRTTERLNTLAEQKRSSVRNIQAMGHGPE